jgi:hypothetical protein
MTPAEEAAIRAAMEKVSNDAMNDGIRAAAQMVRLAALAPEPVSLERLANMIEETAK